VHWLTAQREFDVRALEVTILLLLGFGRAWTEDDLHEAAGEVLEAMGWHAGSGRTSMTSSGRAAITLDPNAASSNRAHRQSLCDMARFEVHDRGHDIRACRLDADLAVRTERRSEPCQWSVSTTSRSRSTASVPERD
jgi:hypothetical protein